MSLGKLLTSRRELLTSNVLFQNVCSHSFSVDCTAKDPGPQHTGRGRRGQRSYVLYVTRQLASCQHCCRQGLQHDLLCGTDLEDSCMVIGDGKEKREGVHRV